MGPLSESSQVRKKKFLGTKFTANNRSPTANTQSLAAGLPGAKVATNTPLSRPMPQSAGTERD